MATKAVLKPKEALKALSLGEMLSLDGGKTYIKLNEEGDIVNEKGEPAKFEKGDWVVYLPSTYPIKRKLFLSVNKFDNYLITDQPITSHVYLGEKSHIMAYNIPVEVDVMIDASTLHVVGTVFPEEPKPEPTPEVPTENPRKK